MEAEQFQNSFDCVPTGGHDDYEKYKKTVDEYKGTWEFFNYTKGEFERIAIRHRQEEMGLAARGRYTHELGKEIGERYKAEFKRYVKSVVQQMIQSAKTQNKEYVTDLLNFSC